MPPLKQLINTPEKQLDLIRFLGYFSGKKHSLDNYFGLKTPDKGLFEQIFQLESRILSEPPIFKKNGLFYEISLFSKELGKYFDEHTLGHQALPWHLLDTSEKKEIYFSWYFLRNGTVSDELYKGKLAPRIIFNIKKNPAFGEEIALLLFELGLLPGTNRDKVEIGDYSDLKKVLDCNWCIDPEKKSRLEKILQEMPPKEDKFTPQEVLEIVQKSQDGKISWKEAQLWAEERDITYRMIHSWLHLDKLPHRTKRFLELKSLEEKIGDPEVMAKLYQQFDLSPIQSRKAAKKLSVQQLAEINNGKFAYGKEIPDYNAFHQKIDFVTWVKYVGRGDLEAKRTEYGIDLNLLFKMFLPDYCFGDKEKTTLFYLHCYRSLKTSSRFPEMVKFEGSLLYLEPRFLDLAETILSSQVGRKRRKLGD